MVVRPQPRLFTVEEYHRMGEAGILGEDDRVELINDEIVRMNPIGSPHAGCVNRLNALLSRHFVGQAVVQVQNPSGQVTCPSLSPILGCCDSGVTTTRSVTHAQATSFCSSRCPNRLSPTIARSRRPSMPPPAYRSCGSST